MLGLAPAAYTNIPCQQLGISAQLYTTWYYDVSDQVITPTGVFFSSVATVPDITVPDSTPDAPTGLGGTQTYEEVTLTWDDPTDDTITGYKIYRDSVVLVEDTGSTTREYVDDTVAGN